MNVHRDVKAIMDRYYVTFFKRHGRGWSSQPFYTCGNRGVGMELVSALKMLGHRVTIVDHANERDDL